MALTIVGLGPGDGRYLTREAWQVLSLAETIVVRTMRHPAVEDLPENVNIVSFDDVYETATSFEEVYSHIVDRVVAMARSAASENRHIVYAVPGHPHVGEATVSAILDNAKAQSLSVRLVAGLSFLEPTLSALGHDALDGLQIVDGLDVAGYDYPPLNCDMPVLLGQIYDRLVAGEVKLALMALYPEDHEVLLVHEAGLTTQSVERTPLYGVDRSRRIDHLTSLYVPPLPVTSSLSGLAETVAYLRGPNGCPWDQEQTSQSLRAGFLEESSEVLQAIDDGDMVALREELGDLLYHVVMQAQLAAEEEAFKLTEAIAGIVGKLKRRHPHVWGDVDVADSREVIQNWEAIKDEEKQGSPQAASVLNSLPRTLPALAFAQKMQQRASKVGFDWPTIDGVEGKIQEELSEVRETNTSQARHMELGDLLFALVNWIRWLGVDAESALRDANHRFERRFRLVERLALERGHELSDMSIEELDGLWEEAKFSLNDEETFGVEEGNG